MLPVQPTGPAISLELDVDDGEVENYEVCLLLFQFVSKFVLFSVDSDFGFYPPGSPQPC